MLNYSVLNGIEGRVSSFSINNNDGVYGGMHRSVYENKLKDIQAYREIEQKVIDIEESKELNKVEYNYIEEASKLGLCEAVYIEEIRGRKQLLADAFREGTSNKEYLDNFSKTEGLLKAFDKSFDVTVTPIVVENTISYYVLQGGTLIGIIDESNGSLISLVKVSGGYISIDAVCNVITYKDKPQKVIWSYNNYSRGIYKDKYKDVVIVDSRSSSAKKGATKTNDYKVVSKEYVSSLIKVNGFYLKEALKEGYEKEIKKAKYKANMGITDDLLLDTNVIIEEDGKEVEVSEREAICSYINKYSGEYIDTLLSSTTTTYVVNVEEDIKAFMGIIPDGIEEVKSMLCDKVYDLNNEIDCYIDIDNKVVLEYFIIEE